MHKEFGGKNEGNRPLGRSRCKREDNIKMNPKEIGLQSLGCNCLAQDMDKWQAVVSRVMNSQVAYNARNFLTS